MNTFIKNLPDTPSEQPLPWYRYGWPWFLISIPCVSIVLGGMMLYLALQTNNSMVVDDYYKQGKAINIRIERDRSAALLGISALVRPSAEGLIVEIEQLLPELPEQLKADAESVQSEFSWPDALDLRWVHITQAERDGESTLISIGGNRYIAQGVGLPADGKYRMHIQPMGDANWRLISELQSIGDSAQIVITAQSVERFFSVSSLN